MKHIESTKCKAQNSCAKIIFCNVIEIANGASAKYGSANIIANPLNPFVCWSHLVRISSSAPRFAFVSKSNGLGNTHRKVNHIDCAFYTAPTQSSRVLFSLFSALKMSTSHSYVIDWFALDIQIHMKIGEKCTAATWFKRNISKNKCQCIQSDARWYRQMRKISQSLHLVRHNSRNSSAGIVFLQNSCQNRTLTAHIGQTSVQKSDFPFRLRDGMCICVCVRAFIFAFHFHCSSESIVPISVCYMPFQLRKHHTAAPLPLAAHATEYV